MIQVLIVEDESALRFIYERILLSLDCDVILARDGREAINALEATIPDLIFLDMLLPMVDGEDVINHMLDSAPRFNDTHVVIASSSKNFEQFVPVLPSAQFILKPILPDQIRQIVQAMINGEYKHK